jgi:hypothetical protein
MDDGGHRVTAVGRARWEARTAYGQLSPGAAEERRVDEWRCSCGEEFPERHDMERHLVDEGVVEPWEMESVDHGE